MFNIEYVGKAYESYSYIGILKNLVYSNFASKIQLQASEI